MASDRFQGTLGFYEFGSAPTIVDPRATGNLDTDLTMVHELAHRDLVNCTIYGYVLATLNMLEKMPEASDRDPGQLLGVLSSRLWRTAEGSATALELLAAFGKHSMAEVQRLIVELPTDYRAACLYFSPIVDVSVPLLPPPIEIILKHSLIQAIAETAADWSLLAPAAFPSGFWGLVDHLLAALPSDEVLPKLAEAVSRIPMERLYLALDNSKKGITNQDNQLLKYNRTLVRECKDILFEQFGIPSGAQPFLNDADRIAAIAAVNTELQAEFPSIPNVNVSGHIFGAEVQIKINEPAFLLPEEEIEAPNLEARLRELALAQGFRHFVIDFLFYPKSRTRSLLAKPIHLTAAGLDLGSPYIICRSVPTDMFERIEKLGISLVWLTHAIRLGANGFYDSDFISSLKLPVYLYLEQFSWEAAWGVLQSSTGRCRSGVYAFTSGLGLAAVALQEDNLTVFGLASPSFPSDSLDPDTERKPIEENSVLASVAMVMLRTSQKNTV